MPSQTADQPAISVKWQETSYGLHIGRATAGYMLQVRRTPEDCWQPRMKVWGPNARFQDLGQPLSSIEEAKDQCEQAYYAVADQAMSAPAPEPTPAPKPAPRPMRSAAPAPVRQAVAERSAPRKEEAAPLPRRAAPAAKAVEESPSHGLTLEEAIAQRDRAIAAFHAALCRPELVIPISYRDLFNEDHPEIQEFKAQVARDNEVAGTRRKKELDPAV